MSAKTSLRGAAGPGFWMAGSGKSCLGLLCWLALAGGLWADIIGTGSNLLFDVNSNGVSEASLTTTGLGLGTTSPSTNLHVLGNAYISNSIGIGTANPLSSLEINGTLAYSIQSVSSNTTLSDNTVIMADTSSSNITLTLPYSGNALNRNYLIKKITNSNELTVVATGNVDGVYDSLAMSNDNVLYPFANIYSGNSTWYLNSSSSNCLSHLRSGLIGWWRLDESSGTLALDSSGNNQHGALNNFASTAYSPYSGKVMGMLSFDGTNDYVNLGSSSGNSTYYFGSGNFSVAGWVKKKASSSGWTNLWMVTRWNTGGSPGTNEWTLDLSVAGSDDKPEFAIDVGSVKLCDATNSLTINQWAHLVGVRDGANLKLYMNGQQETVAGGASGTISNAGRSLRFGGAFSAGLNPNMDLDDVRIYNRALSSAEIQALYNLGR